MLLLDRNSIIVCFVDFLYCINDKIIIFFLLVRKQVIFNFFFSFIILHLIYLSLFFSYLHFFNVFSFFLFFSLYFLWKKYYFLFLTLWIFITIHLTYLYCLFCSCLYFFAIFLTFFLYMFFKSYYTNTKEMMFYCSNFNIVSFFCYVKN